MSDQLLAKETKLLILGDSLSAAYGLKQEQGWVSLLQDAWKDQDVNIINAAISGETTDGALARLPRLLEQHSPTHIFVELGGNDGLQGHPVSKMRANLEKIIQLSQQNKAKVILQQMQIPTNYGTRYTQMFSHSYTLLSQKYAVILLPFFLETIALDKSLMQNDGIHPNATAQVLIAKQMQNTLAKIIFP
ncbi:arylesterase [uncultured Paraglaciecola sp.]|uniref:arylesterase n=1 Tax=uncultured Paraglaciecola sp. TaxID=1765024 RepID=UPI0026320B3D|nr:arylesterase [uncultured Paraglaciecola sp.]